MEDAFNHAESAIAIEEMQERGIIVRTAQFPERDLNEIMRTLNGNMWRIGGVGYQSWWPDIIENRVVVNINPYNDQQKELFNNLLIELDIDPSRVQVTPGATSFRLY